MKTYARMNGNVVANIEIADDNWVASQPNPSIFIEYTESNPASVGGAYVDGYFYIPQPFPSWSRDGQGNWIAPVEKPPKPGPGSFHVWNEESQSWDLITE